MSQTAGVNGSASSGTPKLSSSRATSVPLDSLDAKIIQYHYAIQKILTSISYIKELNKIIKANNSTNNEKDTAGFIQKIIPLTKYIILLNGSIFNVNDNLYRRSEILLNGGKFNPVQTIDPPLNLNYINYDVMDNSTNYDTTHAQIPDLKQSMDSLRLLELLLINTYEIYNKRLKQALIERKSINANKDKSYTEFEFDEIKDLLDFPELASIKSSIASIPINNFKSQDQLKHYLREIDYNILVLNIQNFQASIDSFHEYVIDLTKCKTREDILLLPNYRYTLHRTFLILMKLSDLYGIVRKFGKIIYLNNSHYFENYLRYNEPLKKALQSMDNYFLQSKKSNLLLAQLVRLSRQGSLIHLRVETLSELSKHCNAGYNLLNLMVKSLNLMYVEWKKIIDSNRANEFDKDQLRERVRKQALQTREMEKRKSMMINSSITKKMEAMYMDPNKTKAEKEQQSRLQKELEDSAKEERLIKEAELREKEQSKKDMAQNRIDDRERKLREDLLLRKSSNDSSPSISRTSSLSIRHRSGSVSSNSSANGVGSPLNGSVGVGGSGLARSASVRSPSNARTTASTGLSRRNSMIVSSPSSSSVALNGVPNGETSPLMNRKRQSMILPSSTTLSSASPSSASLLSDSSSTPLSDSSSPSNQNPKHLQEILFPDSLKSPHSAIAGAGAAASLRANQQRQIEKSPYDTKDHVKAAASQAQRNSTAPRLSAKQRLQQHILESSQSGQINSKVLVNKPKVYYNPSSSYIRSPNSSRSSSLQGSSPSSPLNSLTADSRNILQVPTRSRSNSDLSTNSDITLSSPTITRVQGTGRVRSNSASKRPGDNIPDIAEEETSNASSINGSNIPRSAPKKVTQNGTPFPTTSMSVSNSSESSVLPTGRSRSGSTRSNYQSRVIGNLQVVKSEEEAMTAYAEDGSIMKKVRFFGVADYSEDEDAPSPQQSQKQIRRMWSRVTPSFINTANGLNPVETRKKEMQLAKQEGMAFRKFQHQGNGVGTFEGFARNTTKEIPVDSSGKFSMMSMIGGGEPVATSAPPKKLTQLFKRR